MPDLPIADRPAAGRRRLEPRPWPAGLAPSVTLAALACGCERARDGAVGDGWCLSLRPGLAPVQPVGRAVFGADRSAHAADPGRRATDRLERLRTAAGQVARARGCGFPPLPSRSPLWAWHMPGPYAATFRSDVVYWAMHAPCSAQRPGCGRRCWPRGREAGRAALAALVTAVQMGLLGALLTLAPRAAFLRRSRAAA